MNYPYKSILIAFYIAFFVNLLIVCLVSIWLIILVTKFLHTKPKISELLVCIVGIGVIILFSDVFIRCCYDLTYIKNNDYKINQGIVISQDAGGKNNDSRGISFQTDDGEIIEVLLYDGPIYKGEYIEVVYLPNSHIGTIIKRWNDGQEDNTIALEK